MTNEPIYNLCLYPTGSGDFVAKNAGPSIGASSVLSSQPLGAAFTDVFRKDRAPTPRELIQQLVGTAYACATLNSDLVASTNLRLYVATRPGDPQPKGYLRPIPIPRKTLTRLSSDPMSAGHLAGQVAVHEVTHHPLLSLLKSPQGDFNQ